MVIAVSPHGVPAPPPPESVTDQFDQQVELEAIGAVGSGGEHLERAAAVHAKALLAVWFSGGIDDN